MSRAVPGDSAPFVRTVRCRTVANISAKKIRISPEEARELAERALRFKKERGRLPEITSPDAWEKRLAEGVAAFARYRSQAAASG